MTQVVDHFLPILLGMPLGSIIPDLGMTMIVVDIQTALGMMLLASKLMVRALHLVKAFALDNSNMMSLNLLEGYIHWSITTLTLVYVRAFSDVICRFTILGDDFLELVLANASMRLVFRLRNSEASSSRSCSSVSCSLMSFGPLWITLSSCS